jgi:two-component system sensor histidine kinase KdpD
MARGQLRVYLGAAPGVGKTYRMLDEGCRRKARGTDVVVGYLETHGRANTAAQLRDLEVVARLRREYRGATLEEMDVDAILARHPKVALVDELAHTNVPGGRHEKRWQDVEELLDAGIDVITTVNIQHLESVNDVVEKVTGITQRETVPDAQVRRAEQVELVDITPEALRRRLAHGNVYAADKIDAAMSNYFRPGNLSALRELALLWLADRVEDALQRYQAEHDIEATWETRERLLVGVTGAATDEALLRRAARMASRTGAELLAVHVVTADAQRGGREGAELARELTAQLDGRFTEVVDEDVATALVALARSEKATQIVLGASRPRSRWRPPSGIVEGVLRGARDLDVHVIAVGGERPARAPERRRVRQVDSRRVLGGTIATAVALAALTAIMALGRTHLSLSTVSLAFLAVVVGATTWSGAVVGIASAVAAATLENYYFVLPLHTLAVARADDVVALAFFLLFASAASLVVGRLALRSAEAERARAEAEVLVRTAAGLLSSHEDLAPLLETLREVFDARAVAVLVRRDDAWASAVAVGEGEVGESGERFPIDEAHVLAVAGARLSAPDRRLIGAFAARVAAGLRSQVIERDAAELAALAEAESFRLALFRTAADDLGGPLAQISEEVDRLRRRCADDRDAAAALAVVGEQVHRLARLVTNLVDAGRLEASDVAVRVAPVSVGHLLAGAMAAVDPRGRRLELDVADERLIVETDAHLAQRVLANVMTNGCRFGPLEEPVRVTAGVVAGRLEILVVDRGPGVPPEVREAVTAPFDHLAGTSLGAGLNLTVASGFAQLLGGALRFEDTPGGGTTVVVDLPLRAD